MNRLLSTLILILSILSRGQSQTKNFIDQPYIEVSGYGDTLIAPNQIFIKISITEQESKGKISVEEQENKMVSALKELGINTELDLVTSDMMSNFEFYLFKRKDVLKSKKYILKVTDATTASKVFIKLEDIGIANANIDRVSHSDLEKIRASCRIKAMVNAKLKAISLTQPLQQTVGNAIYISDIEGNIENQLQGKIIDSKRRRGEEVNGKDQLDDVQIEFEKIKIKVIIEVKFILK